MKFHLVSTIAAAALVSGVGLAHAQTQQGQQDWRTDRDRAAQMQMQERFQSNGADRPDEQILRQALQQAGFSNIRILDAAYLVQARTPDDRQVMMFIDPPRRDIGRDIAGRGDMRRGSDAMESDQAGRDGPMAQWRDRDSETDRTGSLDAWTDRRQDELRRYEALPQFRDRMGEQGMGTGASGRDAQVGRYDMLEPFGDRRDTQQSQAFADLDDADLAEGIMRAQGMRNLRDIEQENENEFVATVEWYGEEVEARVDVSTGEIVEPNRLSDAQIRNKLGEEGWENVRNLEEREDVIELRADYDGESFDLRLQPQNGRMIEWREAGAG